jgi:hypothetical protein
LSGQLNSEEEKVTFPELVEAVRAVIHPVLPNPDIPTITRVVVWFQAVEFPIDDSVMDYLDYYTFLKLLHEIGVIEYVDLSEEELLRRLEALA